MRKAVLLLTLTLAACGPAYKPLKQYEASREAYRECLIAKGVDKCKTEKALMDADAKAYAIAAGQTLRSGPAD